MRVTSSWRRDTFQKAYEKDDDTPVDVVTIVAERIRVFLTSIASRILALNMFVRFAPRSVCDPRVREARSKIPGTSSAKYGTSIASANVLQVFTGEPCCVSLRRAGRENVRRDLWPIVYCDTLFYGAGEIYRRAKNNIPQTED